MTLAQVTGYFRDPQVSMVRKLLAVAAAAYVVMPLDVIPDILPFVGWLDDLGVIAFTGWYVARDIKRHAQARLTVG